MAVGRHHLSTDRGQRRHDAPVRRRTPDHRAAAARRRRRPRTGRVIPMDIAVLLLSMCFFFAIGMPIAYALALSALVGALVDRLAGRRGHAAICQRRRQGLDADHPVLRAGGRHHGRGRHGQATGRLCGRRRRVHAHAGRPLAGQHPGDHDHERHLRIVGRRHVRDRFGDDPADGRQRLSAGVRNQCDHQRLAAGDHHSAEPQFRDLFAGDRRRGVDHQPVPGRA